MSRRLQKSYGLQLKELATYLKREWRADSPDGLFALHAYEAAGETSPLADLPSLSLPNWLEVGRAPELAAAGYQLARMAAPAPTIADQWRAGMKRLSERSPFPPDRQAFTYRPLELYGITLGTAKLLPETSAERAWLADVLRQLERVSLGNLWAQIIGRHSASHLGVQWSAGWPEAGACQTAEELAMLRWVASSGEISGVTRFDPRPVDAALLRHVAMNHVVPVDLARSAILHHAIRRAVHERLESKLAATWQVSRPTRDALELVVALCRRFHHFARQIQVRREARPTIGFADEYDVQDAIHALLRLHFADVRAEEWVPSYGGRSTRVDILLKPERLFVEVKMTRRGLTQREVISQLTEDKERYRVHPDCGALVCFVYDPAGICDNPAALESDVSVRSGDFRVEVVVVPQGT